MDCPFVNKLTPRRGRGLYANKYFPYGTVLFKMADSTGRLSDFGRIVNHSVNANIYLVKKCDGWYAYGKFPIYQGVEILLDYNTVDL